MAPTDPVTVVDRNGSHRARWGLLPRDAASLKEAKRGSKINAPVETLSHNPRFVRAASDRVMFPASHWFEWKMVDGVKVPYVLRRRDRDYMSFAGVRDMWIDPESGDEIVCGAIVTRSAYAWMNDVHNRMPLVLTLDAEQRWLDADAPVQSVRDEVLAIEVLSDLTAFPVAPIVNKATSDDPAMLEPVGSAMV